MNKRGVKPSATEADAVMTLQEVAAYLKLAESTDYKLVHQAQLPGRKIGGTWRFSRRKLDEWLEQPADRSNS